MVLKHIVLVKFQGNLHEKEKEALVDEFKSLKKQISHVKEFEYGKDISVEGADKGLKHVFLLVFEDEEGRNKYLEHPAHKEYKSKLLKNSEDVVIVDFIPHKVT